MEEFEKFYNKALKFLSYRPRSEKEVRDKLLGLIRKNKKLANTETQKKDETQNFSASGKFSNSVVARETSIIDKVISKLKEKKFINDEEFAKLWIESRNRSKPRSLRLIKLELKQKGISEEIVETIVHGSEFIVKSDLEQAKRLVEKRLPRYKGLDKQKMYEKLGRYLASKGFGWDTIKQSIDPVKS